KERQPIVHAEGDKSSAASGAFSGPFSLNSHRCLHMLSHLPKSDLYGREPTPWQGVERGTMERNALRHIVSFATLSAMIAVTPTIALAKPKKPPPATGNTMNFSPEDTGQTPADAPPPPPAAAARAPSPTQQAG